ncbi:Fic family protein [Ihubacter sp. rT4E-8]|uniref:Fic family protein n=1 Tax=unclassified Ihubacter TaxID=2633299 RepID=UPI00137AEAFC
MKDKSSRENVIIDWIMMNLTLSGSNISRERVQCIVEGGYDLTATLEEHLLVAGLVDVFALIELLLGLSEELSPPTLDKFYQKISGGMKASYRRTTPVLFHLSHSPALPQEIEDELRRLFSRLHDGSLPDPLDRAVYVHNEIIRIYPFDNYSEVIARAALEYELRYCGMDMYFLTLSEQEYNSALAAYLKSGRERVIRDNLEMNRLMRQGGR